jgi:peptide/nickel transport system substrate-binding protein
MAGKACRLVVSAALLWAAAASSAAFAQKAGGVLQMPNFASPASMSIHEESTIVVGTPVMPVFNNLVLFDQSVAQNSMASIVPDLATGWSWSEDGTALTFPLRHRVKWHDGKPFTARDVKCTWDTLMERGPDKLRINPRKAWYRNVAEVTANGDHEVTFHLQRPQPYLLALLASGQSPVYPCQVTPAQMRQHPVGTGPFKFVEFKPNERIKVVKNPDYWKPGRPYLDAIETTIIPNTSTRLLAFATGKFDLVWATPPLMRDLKTQAPHAECELVMDNNSRDLLINRAVPPFDNIDLRRAMALSLDRPAFIDILAEGQGAIGGAILPPPDHVWGMPRDTVQQLPGYGLDVAKNRAEGREIMKKLGYGPDKRLAVKVSTRNVDGVRDAAVIAISQLREVYVDGELRADRHAGVVSAGDPAGLRGRRHGQRGRPRRARPEVLRNLRVGRRAQLRRLLQPGDREADRPAIDGSGPGEAAGAGLGGRTPAGRGRLAAGAALLAVCDMQAEAAQRARDDDQQPLQRLADGRRLARPLATKNGKGEV